jgi:uncharacterized protein DUF1638
MIIDKGYSSVASAPTPCIISCGILRKELDQLREQGHINAPIHYLNTKLHSSYARLERVLSGTIEYHQSKGNAGIVVIYGDVCLGFKGEMETLLKKYGVSKVDGLNCIDCLLGGRGRLLSIDPDHKFLFLNPAFIDFMDVIRERPRQVVRQQFSMLEGIILLDALGDLDTYREDIEAIADLTGLPVVDRKNVGLGGLGALVAEALQRNGVE